VVPPSSIEGIKRYLGSGMIKGIGPHFAGRLVAAFGENVFDVIERTPQRLLEVDGIGKTRLNRITSSWSEQKAIREIMVFLQSHGVGTSRSVRIFKTYGADAIPLVKENPYRLARDIRGIGFKTADQLAQKLGIPKDSMLRARAGLSYALLQAVENGDCALPQDELLKLASNPRIAHPFLNDVQTLASSAQDFVTYYSQALQGSFFRHGETLQEFRRILTLCDFIYLIPVPLGVSAYAKSGNADTSGFHARAFAGGMFFADRWVYFAFILNWYAPERDDPQTVGKFFAAVHEALRCVRDGLPCADR